jgi:hypothetical protein
MARARLQVTCINKTNRNDPHQRISSIGGMINGIRWKHSEDEAINYFEADIYRYFVHRGGTEVDVIIATHNGKKYLKTQPDGLQPDNLLSLPECP